MGLAHEDYVATKAWVNGVARALKERALMDSTDDKTITLSLHRRDEPIFFKQCRMCGWGRKSDKCQCVEKGLV